MISYSGSSNFKQIYYNGYLSKIYLLGLKFWDISERPLTFTALEDTTIQIKQVGSPDAVDVRYRIDNGTLTTYTPSSSPASISLQAGQSIAFWNNTSNWSKSSTDYYQFVFGTGKIAASGNIQSMINYSSTIKSYCYSHMFAGCTSLTTAPQLPATTLASYCYWCMFYMCTSLTAAPLLPATDLTGASYCYCSMFNGCTSLTTAPLLPATTLAYGCYLRMFANIPHLCYVKLPAGLMVEGTVVGSLARLCYHAMFSDTYILEVLITAATSEISSNVQGCYQMFLRGRCDKLKVYFTQWYSLATANWLYDVKTAGTFYCKSLLGSLGIAGSTSNIKTGTSYCPVGWTVINF